MKWWWSLLLKGALKRAENQRLLCWEQNCRLQALQLSNQHALINKKCSFEFTRRLASEKAGIRRLRLLKFKPLLTIWIEWGLNHRHKTYAINIFTTSFLKRVMAHVQRGNSHKSNKKQCRIHVVFKDGSKNLVVTKGQGAGAFPSKHFTNPKY